MKKINNLTVFLILSLLLVLASCEEVIKLDLQNSPSRLVIDATINATDGDLEVHITKSLDFYQTDNFTGINGAKVELVDGSGSAHQVREVNNGYYFTSGLSVKPMEVFRLNIVLASGEHYTARTKAPLSISLDSLKVIRGFGDPRPSSPPVYLLDAKWLDPRGVANFYRFKETKNGHLHGGSFTVMDDKQFDGTVVDMPLYRYQVNPGDTVRLEFQSIDSISFSYFSQINDMARPSFVAATPYNPVGNFDNGALGYFGIYYSDIRDMIISIRK